MVNHEAVCFHNPARRACIICEHLGRDPEEGVACGAGVDLYDAERNADKLRADCEQWAAEGVTE